MPSFRGIYKEIQIMDVFFWKYPEIPFDLNVIGIKNNFRKLCESHDVFMAFSICCNGSFNGMTIWLPSLLIS